MPTEVWIAILSVTTTLAASLFVICYRDISRRLDRVESGENKLNAAILTLLYVKADDHVALAEALHNLLVSGVSKV